MNAASARTAQSIVENLAEHTATNRRVYVDKVDLLSDVRHYLPQADQAEAIEIIEVLPVRQAAAWDRARVDKVDLLSDLKQS